jgi:hypothetical protein
LGHAFLPSDDVLLIRQDGTIKWYPPQGIVERYDLPTKRVESLPGYELVMVERIRLRRTPAGEHASYLGLFKGKSDSIIARFDVIDKKVSIEAETLLRSRAPIASIDFFGAPDTPKGWIGLMERVRNDEAWLYTYEWDHGNLPQLRS